MLKIAHDLKSSHTPYITLILAILWNVLIKAALCYLFCDVRPGAFSESCIWYISNNDKTQKEKNMYLNAQIFQFYAS